MKDSTKRSRLLSLPGMPGHLQSTIASKQAADARPQRSAEVVVMEQRRTGFLQGRRVGLVSAILNMTNAIIGSGVLGLPYIASKSGIGLFIIMLCGTAVIIDYSLQLLVAAACVTHQPGKRFSYELLGEQAFGLPGRFIVSTFIMTQNTANMTSYFVVFKDVIGQLMHLWSDNKYLTSPNFMTTMVATCVVFPIASSSRIGPLAYVGVLQIVIIVLFVFYVLAMCVTHLDFRENPHDWIGSGSSHGIPNSPVYDVTPIEHMDPGSNDTIKWFNPTKDTFLAMPTFCFSFICHTALLPIYDELQEADNLGRTRRPRKRIALSVHAAIGISTVLYTIVSVSGYILFGDEVKPDLLKNFADDKFAPMNHFARIVFTMTILLSIPLQCFPFRKAFTSVIHMIRGSTEPMTSLAKDIWSIANFKTLGAGERAEELGIDLSRLDSESATRDFVEYILQNPNKYQYTLPEGIDTDALGNTLERYVHWIKYGEIMLKYAQSEDDVVEGDPSSENFEVEGCCPPPRDGWFAHLAKTAIAIGLCLGLALSVPQISVVFAVAGATSSVWLELILPAAIYIKLSLRKANLSDVRKFGSILDTVNGDDDGGEEAELNTQDLKDGVSRWAFILPAALCVFGWLAFLISWAGNIWRWVAP